MLVPDSSISEASSSTVIAVSSASSSDPAHHIHATSTPVGNGLFAATPAFARQLESICNGASLPAEMEQRVLRALPIDVRWSFRMLQESRVQFDKQPPRDHLCRLLAVACTRFRLAEMAQEPRGLAEVWAEQGRPGEGRKFRASEALANCLDRLCNLDRPENAPPFESVAIALMECYLATSVQLRKWPRDAGLKRCRRELHAALLRLALIEGTASDLEVARHWLSQGPEAEAGLLPGAHELPGLGAAVEYCRRIERIAGCYVSSEVMWRRTRRLAPFPARIEKQLWRDGELSLEHRKTLEASMNDSCLSACTLW